MRTLSSRGGGWFHTALGMLIGSTSPLTPFSSWRGAPPIEQTFGRARMLHTMLLCAIGCSVSHMLFQDGRMMGSSGIVLALIVLAPLRRIQIRRPIPISFLALTVPWLVKEASAVIANVQDDVSHAGHLAGLLVGGYAGYRFHCKLSLVPGPHWLWLTAVALWAVKLVLFSTEVRDHFSQHGSRQMMYTTSSQASSYARMSNGTYSI